MTQTHPGPNVTNADGIKITEIFEEIIYEKTFGEKKIQTLGIFSPNVLFFAFEIFRLMNFRLL